MSAAGLAPGSLSVLAAPSSLLAAPSFVPRASLAPVHSTCPVLSTPPRAHFRRGDDGEFGPGDWGWGTDIVTTTLTIDATAHDPELTTTVWTTLGVAGASEATHSTAWVTVYEGSGTTLTLTRHVMTLTLSPTPTSLETSTVIEAQTTYETQTALTTTTLQVSSTLVVVPPTATSTPSETLPTTPPPWLTLSTGTSTTRTRSSSSAQPSASAAPSQSDCEPGDEDERERGLFSPTKEQALTLLVAGIYALGILVAWNLFGIRHLLYPFKSLTCLVHESGHLVGLLLSAQPLHRFTIDPNLGGATHTVPHPGRTLRPPGLFLGQIASVMFGGLAVFATFDPLASKYASFVIMALWLAVIALQANTLSRLVCVWPLALLVGIWFIDHASGLRFYVLFLGVMSSFYIIWDTMDDFLHRKQNECCIVMLESNTAVPAFVWLVTWLVTSCALLAGCVLGALALFRHTEHGMYCRRQGFAPT